MKESIHRTRRADHFLFHLYIHPGGGRLQECYNPVSVLIQNKFSAQSMKSVPFHGSVYQKKNPIELLHNEGMGKAPGANASGV